MNRRSFLVLSGAPFTQCACTNVTRRKDVKQQSQRRANRNGTDALELEYYEPKSMLHVHATHIARSRFPLIDFHSHITYGQDDHSVTTIRFNLQPQNCVEVMDRKNIRMMVDATGSYGDALREAISKLSNIYPGRFAVFTEPAWTRASDPGYSTFQADQIEQAHRAGAKGVKVLKTLGLFLRERGDNKLISIDDPRFDEMWEVTGALDMPVAIHSSDPEAFFLPVDRFNERWEELHTHPDWSFYGKDFPSNRALQEARRRVMRRHPRTQFVCLHAADSEDLPYVAQCLDSHPNMHVDIAARIGELGRQPQTARAFFERYQDRILFGTDASGDPSTPQQTFCDQLYEIYYRFLETEDEYFDYAPAPIPPQGRWRIYGLGLEAPVLKKIYFENAARLLGVSV